ncbi:hypothetical protein KFE25_005493 [Diacronema lutheri]|uniref:Major facilitator superfamily (MFS) profile domain-containing protein n=1 Tax=Diacronema lutheri TaxID=2081491 RepID=A0A8J6CFR3_DIALT|nr:hypothetical protein KFE25_005493 [Diacronema lutheri]
MLPLALFLATATLACARRPVAPALALRRSPPPPPETSEATPPADARRSLIALRISTGLVALALSLVVLSPTPALIGAVGADKATSMLQWVAAASAGTEVLLSPIVGALIDALGRKPMLVCATGALALAQALVACTSSVGALLLSQFASSMLIGVFMLSAAAATADLLVATPARLATESAVGMTVLTAGFAVGVPLSSMLPQRLTYTYGVSAALSLAGAAALSVSLGETLAPELRRPFDARVALRTPIACTRLFGASRRLALLSALLALQVLPFFTTDVLQVHALEAWRMGNAERTRLFTFVGASSVGANGLASALIRRLGLRDFTALAGVSHALYWAGVSHSGGAALLLALPTMLGGARSLGVSTLVTAEGTRAGLRQGQLAGDRANLFALVKVVGPIVYAQLYARGKAIGLPQLPFVLNAVLMLAAAMLSYRLLPTGADGNASADEAAAAAAAPTRARGRLRALRERFGRGR